MPLMVQGISSAVSASKPTGGIDKVGEDFKHKPKLMQSLGGNERQKVPKKQAGGAADLPSQVTFSLPTLFYFSLVFTCLFHHRQLVHHAAEIAGNFPAPNTKM